MTLTRYLTQLLKGNTDVLILSLLEREAMYGHQLMDELERASSGFFKISEGTLYPALHRLTRNGLIRGKWGEIAPGKERKLYTVTPKGEQELAACRSTWGDFATQHDYLSTAPDSGFVRIGMAQCRDATGVDVVRGLIAMRVGDARASEPLTDRKEWFAALRELCGLHFDATPPEVLDRLWSRTLANHRSWEPANRP